MIDRVCVIPAWKPNLCSLSSTRVRLPAVAMARAADKEVEKESFVSDVFRKAILSAYGFTDVIPKSMPRLIFLPCKHNLYEGSTVHSLLLIGVSCYV